MTATDEAVELPATRDRERLAKDLEFSVWAALAGIGTAHGGKRAADHLKSDLARSVAPKALGHMLSRGWQFRHRTWPKGEFIGDPDGWPSVGSMAGHMPVKE